MLFEDHSHNSLDEVDLNNDTDDDSTYASGTDDSGDDDDENAGNDVAEPNNDPGVPTALVEMVREVDDSEVVNGANGEEIALNNDDEVSTEDDDAEEPGHVNDDIGEENRSDPQPLPEIQTNDDRMRRELHQIAWMG